jgi:class 3 adenylate cyclase
MPIDRSLEEVFARHAEKVKSDIRKCVPATVTAVHPDKQTVDVQVGVNQLLFDDLGNAVSMPAPSYTDVPLGVLRGGGFFVWVPVAAGDTVLLVFSDLSCDSWRSGDASAPVDPVWAGVHTHDSPFAIPMVAPDAKALTSPAADPSKIIIGKDGGTAQIRIGSSDIELGAPASDAVALASKLDLFIAAFVAWTPNPGDGGAALKTALSGFLSTFTTTGSTTVKCAP